MGGGFGGKLTRNNIPTLAAGLAAFKLQRPVAMQLTMIENMDIIGKRDPTAANYEVGVDDNGIIQYLNYDYYFDYGTGGNEGSSAYGMGIMPTSYKSDTWTMSANNVHTDRHASCSVRAPGRDVKTHKIRTIAKNSIVY